ncbi:MAG TPA: hypothetical protein VGN07_14165 [Steroidobacteraceae bacterium]
MATEVNNRDQKRGIRRTALWLTLVALSFYAAFILMSVVRAR